MAIRMTKKRLNWMFLLIILCHLALLGLVLMGAIPEHILESMLANIGISELILMVPALLVGVGGLIKSGEKVSAEMGFTKMKLSNGLLIILITLLLEPMVITLNALTMLVTDNAMVEMSDTMLSLPFIVTLLMVGIIAPFCEEFVFRGLLYRGYRKQTGVCGAAVLSALLFGLMHMNFNQAVYAFALGIALALMVEATKSLWASILCHMFFNSSEVMLMYISNHLMPGIYEQSKEIPITNQEMYITIAVYLVLTAITLPCAICLLVYIAKRQKTEGCLKEMIKPQKKELRSLFSIPLVVAILLCIIVICIGF